ncbi:tRNA (N6-threonylcarbamoyladenosine(37)-N6)-methyltransferase TrmO [Vibrio sp. CyArs1]|uniref:tRNA (N6-threonylcarbamoyladenosine(37)-N6)-methyltransferase TrmO n=1 Tax=Vibrio sp. CyArs1 TaxID=2682577 RepID=UPI001F05B7E9|nr:tRNA (N6-threonylcarbamoyladenosine(37)-N6)-methyltransferase TrmO [Vibrio sp. CyArs1]
MKPTLDSIGHITTPYQHISDCPNNIQPTDGPMCTIHINPAYNEGIKGLYKGDSILVLYWLNEAQRSCDVYGDDTNHSKGTFALRTPHRPNPIGAAIVEIEGIKTNQIFVRGLDCLNSTPLLDIKPAIYKELPSFSHITIT